MATKLSRLVGWSLWLAAIAVQTLRSISRWVAASLFFHRRNFRAAHDCNPIPYPILLLPGNMSDAAAAAQALRKRGYTAFDAAVGPVSSCHDRACEAFYALVGGAIDYGMEHAKLHGHKRFGRHIAKGLHPHWSAANPIVLVCHSQGCNTALGLLELLANGSFEGHNTSAAWVVGVVTIASPLGGVPALHTLPGAGVPPPEVVAIGESSTMIQQPVGRGLVALAIVLGYILHALQETCLSMAVDPLSPSLGAWVRTNPLRLPLLFDWRLTQWELSLRDIPALLTRRHRVLCTSDTALYELTPSGAAHRAENLRMHANVYYCALPCQITEGPWCLPSSQASPLHVITAALVTASASCACAEHSDGLLATSMQSHPPGRLARIAKTHQLNPPLHLACQISNHARAAGPCESCNGACESCNGACESCGAGLGAEGGGVGVDDEDWPDNCNHGSVATGLAYHHSHGAWPVQPPEAPSSDAAAAAGKADAANGRSMSRGGGAGAGALAAVLTPGSSRRSPRDIQDLQDLQASLAAVLTPGSWWSPVTPWRLDHAASALHDESPTLEYALTVILPAMCTAHKRDETGHTEAA